ncbi:MAG: YraN family protein [Bryobacterales bacterium]|nr:YraN family protein [Bryobacterales bacterium]
MLALLFRLADGWRSRARRRVLAPGHALGRDGEDAAHRFLQAAGLIVVARNYAPPGGTAEVDLVAHDAGTLVFVEVKTRATDEFGAPERAIDSEKRAKIRRAARQYVRRAGHDPALVRFDTISIVMTPERRLEHVRDAWR